jgi:hypothetical protein
MSGRHSWNVIHSIRISQFDKKPNADKRVTSYFLCRICGDSVQWSPKNFVVHGVGQMGSPGVVSSEKIAKHRSIERVIETTRGAELNGIDFGNAIKRKQGETPVTVAFLAVLLRTW